MKIMSWNVNQFRGWNDETNWFEIIKNVIENVVKNEQQIDNIVILQEVPCLDEIQAKLSSLTKDYEIVQPENSKAKEATIAITKKNSAWMPTQELYNFSTNSPYNFPLFFENKYVELSHPEYKITLLGVHMPIDFDGPTDDIKLEFWDRLADYVNRNERKSPIIIGDFNAGDYNKTSFTAPSSGMVNRYRNFITYKGRYINLLNCGYADRLDGHTTKYKTPIDHILVPQSMNNVSGQILSDIKLSDHYPIVAEISDNLFNKSE